MMGLVLYIVVKANHEKIAELVQELADDEDKEEEKDDQRPCAPMSNGRFGEGPPSNSVQKVCPNVWPKLSDIGIAIISISKYQ